MRLCDFKVCVTSKQAFAIHNVDDLIDAINFYFRTLTLKSLGNRTTGLHLQIG